MRIPGAWQRAALGAMLLDDDPTATTPRPTIFAEMSALATATGAINLGQGFPDEDGPTEILEAAMESIRAGNNQYPPGLGMPVLRDAIAAHQSRFYGLNVDADREVLVTAGATEALAATILALTDDGDEVVTFEPFYDAYAALIALARAKHVRIPLRAPTFQPDHDDIRAAISDRTRIILINNPHNPTGSVLDRDTLALIVDLAHRFDAIIVTDEVYEHLTFDAPHIPIATLPGARERTVTISSGGKTFSTTGWKIGWLTAPAPLVIAVTAVKQFLTYVNGAPFQPAMAVGLGLPDEYFHRTARELKAKRDILTQGLLEAGFTVSIPAGSYFVVADSAPFGASDADDFCRELPGRAGVAAVPLTAFVHPANRADYATLVRFAFCKKRHILTEATVRLAQIRE